MNPYEYKEVEFEELRNMTLCLARCTVWMTHDDNTRGWVLVDVCYKSEEHVRQEKYTFIYPGHEPFEQWCEFLHEMYMNEITEDRNEVFAAIVEVEKEVAEYERLKAKYGNDGN